MADTEAPHKLGRYEIIRELGKGAMGVVYEGKDPNIGRRVAIKTARRDVMEATGMADEMMARFLREAHAAGALNHPNIITIFDADEQDDMAYIAMEFLEGGDLQDVIDEHRKMDMEEIVDIGATICGALAVAHDAGIVHRDVKPANILMPKSAPLKVADFGIAHVSDSNLTQEGALIGTPHYMSPEQFMGQKLDGRSDLFSVGIILYELVTGEKPFTGEALSTVMHHVIKTDPTPPKEFNFAMSDALNDAIMKILSKRPNDRYPDGRAMAAALRESLKDNPDPAVLGFQPKAASAADATVVAATPAADATVLSPTAQGAAAVPSADATVAKPAPGVPRPAAPAAEAAAETVSDMPEAVPAKPLGKGKLIGIGGGVAALIVVGLIVAVTLGDGDDSGSAGIDPGGGPEPEAYFDKFSGAVHVAATEQVYNDYFNGLKDWDDIKIDVERAEGVTVQLFSGDNEVPFQTIADFVNGDTYPLSQKCEVIRYRILYKGKKVNNAGGEAAAMEGNTTFRMSTHDPVVLKPD